MITFRIDPEKKHKISPYLYMQFMEPLGVADSSVDAGWDFYQNRWQPNLMARVRELAPTMVRWGGIFASYYHWREAVGPTRIPMRNYRWGGMFYNQVGTREVMDFCREAGAEPLLVVNMESDGFPEWGHPEAGVVRIGSAEEAADWVSYCNDPQNAERLAHGVKEPYNVKYWQIGNETSYTNHPGFTAAQCCEVTARFAAAMKERDPSIKLIGWGDESKTENWCRPMSRVEGIDLIAFHHHFDSGLPDSPLCTTKYRESFEANWPHLMNA